MKKPYNRSMKAMIEKSKEQQEVRKFNKSEEGQELHQKVREAHNKEQIDPKDLPF